MSVLAFPLENAGTTEQVVACLALLRLINYLQTYRAREIIVLLALGFVQCEHVSR